MSLDSCHFIYFCETRVRKYTYEKRQTQKENGSYEY